MKILLFALVLFTFAGCATAPENAPSANFFRARPVTTPEQADTALAYTLAGCQRVLRGFEAQANNLKSWRVAAQTIGGVLGAILLPVAVVKEMAQSVIVLLGAGAGFANTEVSVFEQGGLSAVNAIEARAGVLAAMQASLQKFYAARSAIPFDAGKTAVAIDDLRVSCISYEIASPQAATIPVPTAPESPSPPVTVSPSPPVTVSPTFGPSAPLAPVMKLAPAVRGSP